MNLPLTKIIIKGGKLHKFSSLYHLEFPFSFFLTLKNDEFFLVHETSLDLHAHIKNPSSILHLH